MLAKKNHNNGKNILNPQAVSFLIQYKVVQMLGMNGPAINHVSPNDLGVYALWVQAAFPAFFDANDQKQWEINYLQNLIWDVPGLAEFLKENPSFFWQKAYKNPDLMIAICDPNQRDTATALLRSLRPYLKSQKIL